jgi:hypothetical protein
MTRWDGPPPQVVRVDLQTVELKGQLDENRRSHEYHDRLHPRGPMRWYPAGAGGRV